jgi:hypothetical protein
MTLILTAVTPHYILQVSDRLISIKSRPDDVRPADARSNKVVVYQPTDGMVTIAYAGLAYINNVNTDTWLAELLSGISLQEDNKAPPMRMGPVKNLWSLSVAIRNIEASMAKHVPRTQSLTIIISGWRDKKRNRLPFYLELVKSSGTHDVIRKSYGAHRWISRIHDIGAVSPRALLASKLNSAIKSGAPLGPNKIEDVLVETIREVASQCSTVGPDVLTVVLERRSGGCRCLSRHPMPANFRMSLPAVAEPRAAGFAELAAIMAEEQESTHAPWFVSSRLLWPPTAVLGSDMSVPFEAYPFFIKATPASGKYEIFAIQGRRRPTFASLVTKRAPR